MSLPTPAVFTLMLSRLAQLLLIATALSPMLGAVAVDKIARGEPWQNVVPWLVAGVALFAICWLLLFLSRWNGPVVPLKIARLQSNDQEVVAFLLAYFVPFLAAEQLDLTGQWMTAAYVMAILILTLYHAKSFHFNPVMGLLYHFYSIETSTGMPALLISKRERTPHDEEFEVIQVASGIYLSTE